MKERPALFSTTMVRAILDGSKAQTRRVVKPRKDSDLGCELVPNELAGEINAGNYRNCPYGQPGDRLWVRETFCPIFPQDPTYNGGRAIEYDYRATYQHGDRLGDSLGIPRRWKPAIHMPRAACRITLEITGVRIEKLHAISEGDAKAEGAKHYPAANHLSHGGWSHDERHVHETASASFQSLWESINGAGSWATNPWVWVVEFKRVVT